ncbi:hypothetical protein NDU88_002733 [Pleurodeles waltl]|uniref:Uncharacterized protein n=1 Tax=Pleurodeles waltl TaxID=8319 RepID=A0AAV7QA77_PLEWA|nr:hypothetical protein NDU88_002733 [Pleurodeles waltl]
MCPVPQEIVGAYIASGKCAATRKSRRQLKEYNEETCLQGLKRKMPKDRWRRERQRYSWRLPKMSPGLRNQELPLEKQAEELGDEATLQQATGPSHAPGGVWLEQVDTRFWGRREAKRAGQQ